MISPREFAQIHHLAYVERLGIEQIARELNLNAKTVSKYLKKKRLDKRAGAGRSSQLDPYKALIRQWLAKHDFSAQQIFQKLQTEGYQGAYTILRQYVKAVRPRPEKAFLSLAFAPGECAQVDWGSAGNMPVGNTHRRVSFFVMTLGYSRRMYVEFTLSQTTEHFLSCHQNAFEYFGGVPQKILIDNLKTGVLKHERGLEPVLNPRYVDFAKHYDFVPVACNVRAPQEKGRVERSVGYVKSNFLRGLDISDFKVLPNLAKLWLDQTANRRIHRETGKKPIELFEQEKPELKPLPVNPYDIGVSVRLRASRSFRITLDTNKYSVPAQYASHYLDVRIYPDKILVYHQGQQIANHLRHYGRKGDFENPDHPKALLAQRQGARIQKQLQCFLQLGEHADRFYEELQRKKLNPNHHISKILALAEQYGRDKVAGALSDAITFGAFGAEYIANILEQRSHILQEPGPLHVTHQSDLLELDTPQPDLSIYQQKN